VRLDLGDRAQTIAFLVRDYSPALTAYIVGRLPRDGTFFDVGANIGLISFGVASLRPDVAVHAFEPNPSNTEAWRHNQRLNDAVDATLCGAAASDRAGQADFAIPSDSASGTIRPDGEHTVATITLDDYCAEHGITYIDVLKIDVEGHELPVLLGASRLLATGVVGAILCEVSQGGVGAGTNRTGPISDLLQRHGFARAHIPSIGMRRLVPGSAGSETDGAFERSDPREPQH
jgi:FkbM family methyltransferase